MDSVWFIVVDPEMIWLWYYDEKGSKHFKELLGKDVAKFLKTQESGVQISSVAYNQVNGNLK